MKLFLLFSVLIFSTTLSAQNGANNRTERLRLAAQMEKAAKEGLLDKWYPQSVDSVHGGFISTYTYDFKPTGPQDKFIVTQARHTWSTAKASERYPQQKYFIACAKWGYQYLRDVAWDKTHGGFHSLLTRSGTVKSNPKAPKDAYGNAFAIYALAAYYKASADTGALRLAQDAFWWLEKHSHDEANSGYYQHLQEDGKPVVRSKDVPVNSDLGYKDQNSSIHLLEAFTELYAVWPDAAVRRRLEEMLYLIRDKITTPKGYLTLFFTPDWQPVSFQDSSETFIRKNKALDHVSFGHDVETAYLMLEASHALGLKEDTATMTVAKRMVDHALQNGWDEAVGGFYNEGYYFKAGKGISILFDSKNWWAQAEGMNTLLLMADHFPNDKMRYYDKFLKLWRYIQTYLIDHRHGDWYEEGLDKEPRRKTGLKGHIWKGTYHHYRALANCVDRLRQ